MQSYNRNKLKIEPEKKTVIKCHNCNEGSHKNFRFTKTPSKYNICSKIGHLELYCRHRWSNIQDVERTGNTTKTEKQVDVLDQAGNLEKKNVV